MSLFLSHTNYVSSFKDMHFDRCLCLFEVSRYLPAITCVISIICSFERYLLWFEVYVLLIHVDLVCSFDDVYFRELFLIIYSVSVVALQ